MICVRAGGIPTFAVRTIVPVCALVTEMGQLRLTLNMHAFIACLDTLGKVILLVTGVLDNKILLPFHCIFE